MAISASEHFFEGAEKLLEVWFSSSSDGQTRDLRTICRSHWEKLLKLVRCEVISFMRDDHMDSYVLSESSMFVTRNRFILKTCGATTVLAAAKPLLQLAKQECGFNLVANFFYSRKNFRRPELQHLMHQSFDKEVDHLEQLFTDGVAYVLGPMNKDCWYLYTLGSSAVTQADQTLELLMWGLCPDKMDVFTRRVCSDGEEATQRSGVCDLHPGMQIGSYLFEPCGYSMNGLIAGGYYITIHVTPESQCSYVSFESNIPQESYDDLVKKVLHIFSPDKFLLTVIANKASLARDCHKHLEQLDTMEGYQRHDHHLVSFQDYRLTYVQFSRPVI